MRASSANRACKALGLIKGARSYQRQASGGVIVCCPWHADRSPSCSVRVPPDGDGSIACKCFSCDASGDVFHLVAAVHGLDVRSDFARVLEEAARVAGRHDLLGGASSSPGGLAPSRGDVGARRGGTTTATAAPAPTSIAPLGDDLFHAVAAAILQKCPLSGEPDVVEYLTSRGLAELAEEAGWAALPRSSNRLAARVADVVGVDVAVRSGLVHRPRGTWRFVWNDHRLLIPFRAPDGRIVSLQRRLVRAPLSAGESRYIFPRGRRPGLFFHPLDLANANAADTIAFCEGALDSVALRALTKRDGLDVLVLGLPGTGTWRAEWGTWATGRKVFLALDADAAGDARAKAMVPDLHGAREIFRWRPREGRKDWTEMLLAVGGTP